MYVFGGLGKNTQYAGAMAYVEVELPSGVRSIGSAFHVGSGVFITARHVVEDVKIISIATTEGRLIPDPEGMVQVHGSNERYRKIFPGVGQILSGPHFHPDPKIDVAALVVGELEPAVIPLGSHMDDWLNDEAFILQPTIVMGYPPVPFSSKPVLITASAEINAIIDKYTGGHPHFVISAMPRGGFSGGPCLIGWEFALGVITEALVKNNQEPELGFMSVISVEPLFVCMQHHGIVPDEQKDGWDGFWD